MLIDIGVNLTNRRFQHDADAVVDAAIAAGVGQMVITGTDVLGSQAAARLAETRPGVLFSTAGVHPHDARGCDGTTLRALEHLIPRDVVVAIGECGLDYNRNYSSPPLQREWFEAQLKLAVAVQLPLFLHERDAFDDLKRIIEPYLPELPGAVVHCFTGGPAEAEAYLEMGLHLGVTGWVCDERRGTALQAAMPLIPTDRLMLETDAPYLLPRDLPKQTGPERRRNEPRHLPHIAMTVANLTGRPLDEIIAGSAATTRAFFNLPTP